MPALGQFVTESTGIGGSKTVEIKKIDRDPSQKLTNLVFQYIQIGILVW